ncbi:MAG: esterase-like activity of phytase family protein [Gemmobacter sp.]|nr:esterase-like activity of phytase family protein [Gemmobacter sp.]
MRRRSVLALIACAALSPALALDGTGGAEFNGSARWRASDTRIGGVSAIHVYDDGVRFLALSDRGRLISGRFIRDAQGRIASVTVDAIHALKGTDGKTLAIEDADSEGIAVGPDGRIYVSFEGLRVARVLAYDRVDGPATALPRAPEFVKMRLNKALESLAIDQHGRLHTLPEDTDGDRFPLFRLDGNQWKVIAHLARLDSFLPVSADFGPDGRFYILERDFRVPAGFSTRLRRFAPGDWTSPETLIHTRGGRFGNLEGMSVTYDTNRRLRVTMVSDDNFLPIQRAEIIEYFLPA